VEIDAYTPLFVAGFALLFLCNFIFFKVRGDNQYGLRQFTGLFLRGNPFLAMGSLIRYQYAREEHEAVKGTERLGQAKSLVTVDELLDALADPRFQVRFEAIISIARMPPDARLVNALIEILNGTELALSVVAAWALGRMGDHEALPALRSALDSPYHSIQAHSARALGALGDQEIVPEMIKRLATETDKGLLMAYASALGKLHAIQATDQLLTLFYNTTNPGARREMALCLARLVGDEHHFITLMRNLREDLGTAAAQAVTAFKKKVDRKGW
jgi:HEAT repeat protein